VFVKAIFKLFERVSGNLKRPVLSTQIEGLSEWIAGEPPHGQSLFMEKKMGAQFISIAARHLRGAGAFRKPPLAMWHAAFFRRRHRNSGFEKANRFRP